MYVWVKYEGKLHVIEPREEQHWQREKNANMSIVKIIIKKNNNAAPSGSVIYKYVNTLHLWLHQRPQASRRKMQKCDTVFSEEFNQEHRSCEADRGTCQKTAKHRKKNQTQFLGTFSKTALFFKTPCSEQMECLPAFINLRLPLSSDWLRCEVGMRTNIYTSA